ncbi:site-specific DNA-methyltransferase [Paenibacillus sp. FSL H7-689]|uniref:site-specific DNA-methyltransferase n=1 Tax=Paenibacillus sp. FSL H7-689 TaxID=1227349 RepID=UPI0003E22883|nr:site-specific DNA-methyltransferase [Paenibacillus sp. FSL H7-689]ETT51577.1 type III restriction system methyltransferase [Paenibacillus sp. FSL H7-689]
MDKLKMHSSNKVNENIEKIAALFPNCKTEVVKGHREDGTPIIEYTIDFDMLRQELSDVVVEGPTERYQFTWPEKRKSILAANAPIAKTLRPCREESVDFDNTENLYIEGDNLDALKLLQETYLGKVKLIYIDPPYNTGNDFIYEDDFSESAEKYMEHSGDYDDEGNRLVKNTSTNGRFHTDWLNMIYPRLKLAKDLLIDDGVIFISIDDNEVENLRKAADEIFGTDNFVANIIWEKKYAPANDAKWLSDNHDHILLYAKCKSIWRPQLLARSDEMNSRYTNRDNDPRGVWKAADMTVKSYSSAYDYPITTPSGRVVTPSQGRCWNTSKENFEKLVADNRIWFGEKGHNVPAVKKFLTEVQDGIVPMTLWKYEEVGHNQEGRQEVKKLFDDKGYFDGPKPTKLLNRILTIANLKRDSIVLDFFSGSATTADAVMQLNAEDDGNRKFIMVQLPEETEEKSEAYKAGYKNICEIGKERIRRAANKIRKKNPEVKFDGGFRTLKVDSTNMEDVYYNPTKIEQAALWDLADNIKPDRTPEDLLFQVMLDLGVLLSSKIEEAVIGSKKVFFVADGYLLACFDDNVTDEVVTEIAKRKPYYFVMRDSSLSSDSTATNFEQIFASYSPTTIRKVL